MKKYVIAVAVICAIILLSRIPDVFRAKHSRTLACTWYAVNTAALRLGMDGTFTNSYPNLYRLFVYSNRYTISGTNYQCVVAADSWDYRSRSNLLAFTTNGVYLFIDSHGAQKLSNWYDLPGYFK